MYTVIRNHKSVLLSLVFIGAIAITAYFCIRFHQLLQYAGMNLPTIEAAWALPALAACMLVFVAARKRGFLLGFLIYLSGAYVLCDLLRLIVGLLAPGAANVWAALYCGGAFPILTACILCAYGYLNAKAIRVTAYRVALEGLRAPARIAMISDLHLGVGRKAADLPAIVEAIMAQSPDVILLAGDIYEEKTTREQFNASLDAFSKLDAPLGIYYVIGNHEYAAAQSGSLSLDRLMGAFESAGITTLRDDAVMLGGRFTLLGRNDASSGKRLSLEAALKGLPGDCPLVVLDHRPTGLAQADEAGVGLHLSGHTHAGQLFPVGRLGEWYGHSDQMYGYRDWGGLQSIVSSGIGTWGFSLRIGSPCEVVVVDLDSAKG